MLPIGVRQENHQDRPTYQQGLESNSHLACL